MRSDRGVAAAQVALGEACPAPGDETELTVDL